MSRKNKAGLSAGRPILGLVTVELHLPDAQSLKTKRMVVKSLKDRLKRRFNVAVAEIGYTELWQRAEIAAVSVASARSVIESELEAIGREIEDHSAAEIVRIDSELIE